MTNKTFIVKSHQRKRRDRVGEALKAATSLRNARTVHDWLIEYSRTNDDETAKLADRILWHLDPVALRSAITQAQARLHVVAPEIRSTEGDLIRKAHPGGEYRHLLGKTLFPSAPKDGKKKTGKPARWCGDTEERMDRETTPDGMDNPIILTLISAASAAGDTNFSKGDDVRKIAVLPQGTRTREINLLMQQFTQRAILNARIIERDRVIEEKDKEIALITADRDKYKRLMDRIPTDINWEAVRAAANAATAAA